MTTVYIEGMHVHVPVGQLNPFAATSLFVKALTFYFDRRIDRSYLCDCTRKRWNGLLNHGIRDSRSVSFDFYIRFCVV